MLIFQVIAARAKRSNVISAATAHSRGLSHIEHSPHGMSSDTNILAQQHMCFLLQGQYWYQPLLCYCVILDLTLSGDCVFDVTPDGIPRGAE